MERKDIHFCSVKKLYHLKNDPFLSAYRKNCQYPTCLITGNKRLHKSFACCLLVSNCLCALPRCFFVFATEKRAFVYLYSSAVLAIAVSCLQLLFMQIYGMENCVNCVNEKNDGKQQ